MRARRGGGEERECVGGKERERVCLCMCMRKREKIGERVRERVAKG